MEKIIFLDVDGTLCNEQGIVPESAKQAIKKAQARGHRFFLCTGRSKAEITDEVAALGLDGMIGAGGGYCEVQNEVILHKVFDEEEVRQLVTFLSENQIEYYLESNQGLFASPGLKAQLRKVILAGTDPTSAEGLEKLATIEWFLDLLEEDQTKIDYQDINKVSFINQSIPYEQIHETYHGKFQMMRSTVPAFGKDSGEIALANISKRTAIQHLLNHLGESNQATFAFGDGHNDLEMFAAVNTGIAMGNACDELKAVADHITKTHDDHGIAVAMAHFGLIEN